MKTILALAALAIMPNALRSEICELQSDIQVENEIVTAIREYAPGTEEPFEFTMDNPTEEQARAAAYILFSKEEKERASACLKVNGGHDCWVMTSRDMPMVFRVRPPHDIVLQTYILEVPAMGAERLSLIHCE